MEKVKQALERAWAPTERQAEFLAASEKEVLYGGAAGGGKSDALIVDALGLHQQAVEYSSYRAILFRRTYGELRDLIDRAQEIIGLANPGARYNQSDHIYTFPSGAKLEFGHVQHNQDRFKYKRAFQYAGWDELTLWPDDVPYVYLRSRVRSTETRLDCYIRGTTNPDGPGQVWVKERFAIPNEGTATCFKVTVVDDVTGEEFVEWRRFIPARLSDNPYLTRTADYRIALLSMEPEEREALLRGRWDAIGVKGSYYGEIVAKLRANGYIRRVPYQPGVPVDTYWDLGRSDSTSLWFHQLVAGEDRFIACYENSGEALDHYVTHLQSRGYVYGTHWLPHDAAHERLTRRESEPKCYADMLKDLIPAQAVEVLPRVDDLHVGINATRQVLPNCLFDEIECKDGVVALERHRKKWDEKQQVFRDSPVEDRYIHYADAFRQFGQRMMEGRESVGYKRPGKRPTSWKHI